MTHQINKSFLKLNFYALLACIMNPKLSSAQALVHMGIREHCDNTAAIETFGETYLKADGNIRKTHKWTKQDIKDIQKLRLWGATWKSIGVMFGCSGDAVFKVHKRYLEACDG